MRSGLLSILLLASGCSYLDADTGADPGEFTATLRGAINLNIHGAGSSLSQSVQNRFDVSLRRQGVDWSGFIIFDLEGTTREVGTYAIGTESGKMRAVYDVDTRTDQEFVGTSGELVISQIRETDVLGTFAFTGIDGGGLVVTVTGQFRVPTSAAEAYL